jgi:hypothetical protein
MPLLWYQTYRLFLRSACTLLYFFQYVEINFIKRCVYRMGGRAALWRGIAAKVESTVHDLHAPLYTDSICCHAERSCTKCPHHSLIIDDPSCPSSFFACAPFFTTPSRLCWPFWLNKDSRGMVWIKDKAMNSDWLNTGIIVSSFPIQGPSQTCCPDLKGERKSEGSGTEPLADGGVWIMMSWTRYQPK